VKYLRFNVFFFSPLSIHTGARDAIVYNNNTRHIILSVLLQSWQFIVQGVINDVSATPTDARRQRVRPRLCRETAGSSTAYRFLICHRSRTTSIIIWLLLLLSLLPESLLYLCACVRAFQSCCRSEPRAAIAKRFSTLHSNKCATDLGGCRTPLLLHRPSRSFWACFQIRCCVVYRIGTRATAVQLDIFYRWPSVMSHLNDLFTSRAYGSTGAFMVWVISKHGRRSIFYLDGNSGRGEKIFY